MIEPHKFVPWNNEPSLCSGHGFYGCAKLEDDPIHQQERQQCGSCAGNLPNHEEGCFYKLAQESQPATYSAEGSREPEVDPKCLSASQQDSLEYARGWVGHLDDNPIANDHNNCVIAAFEELAQAKQAGEYRSHLEAELLQAQIRIAELESEVKRLKANGPSFRRIVRAVRLAEERSK